MLSETVVHQVFVKPAQQAHFPARPHGHACRVLRRGGKHQSFLWETQLPKRYSNPTAQGLKKGITNELTILQSHVLVRLDCADSFMWKLVNGPFMFSLAKAPPRWTCAAHTKNLHSHTPADKTTPPPARAALPYSHCLHRGTSWTTVTPITVRMLHCTIKLFPHHVG